MEKTCRARLAGQKTLKKTSPVTALPITTISGARWSRRSHARDLGLEKLRKIRGLHGLSRHQRVRRMPLAVMTVVTVGADHDAEAQPMAAS